MDVHIISVYINQGVKQLAESILFFIGVIDAEADGKISLCVTVY